MVNEAASGLLYIASNGSVVLNNTYKMKMKWKEMFLA